MHTRESLLSLAAIGTGRLHEHAFFKLATSELALALVAGTDRAPGVYLSDKQVPIAPWYYATKLQAPRGAWLETARVWDAVTLSTEISTYRNLLFESVVELAGPHRRPGEPLPKLHASWAFWAPGAQRAATPHAGSFAPLADLSRIPEPQIAFARATSAGTLDPGGERGAFSHEVEYRVVAGRDADCGSGGHAYVECFTFVHLLDFGEREWLRAQLEPELLDARLVEERETFYLGRCTADDRVNVRTRGQCERHAPVEVGDWSVHGMISTFQEVVDERGGVIVAARTRKAIATRREA